MTLQILRPVLRVCAWCTSKAELDRLHIEHPDASHGICPDCLRRLEAEELAR